MAEDFFLDCGGPYDLTSEHTITSWESQPTSGAEAAIIALLESQPQRYVGKRLLHIGIGNSSLFVTFAAGLAGYVGITISHPEIELFRKTCGKSGKATAILMNKYDPRMYPLIEGHFDIIVDTMLKSYACCEKHFLDMMRFLASILNKGGTLMTTESGVRWGWRGNTARSYTPGAQLDPAIARFRVLDRERLQSLGAELGLTMSCARVAYPHGDRALDDDVLILTKDDG